MTDESKIEGEYDQAEEHGQQKVWTLIGVIAITVLSFCVYEVTSNWYWVGIVISGSVTLYALAATVSWSITGDIERLRRSLNK